MNPPRGPVFESLTRPEWMGWRRRRAFAVKYAQERDALPTPAEWRAAGRDDMPGLCMTGDGELPVRGLLCARCVARPYGTEGEPMPADECHGCYGTHKVWLGNGWAGLRRCGMDCPHPHHADEVWLAAA